MIGQTTKSKNFINNRWIDGTGPSFASIDPATDTIVWKGKATLQPEVDLAVESARKAFPSWAALPISERTKFLLEFKKILAERKNAISEIISKETGKPMWESLSEVGAMIGKIDVSIDAYAKRCPHTKTDLPNGLLQVRHKPHGVVGIFGPFNFPGHLPNGHIVPALLAGNTIVFKPSEQTPFTAEAIIECWEQCSLPQGVLNMIQGGRETGQALASHPKINGLYFTGSWQTGRIFLKEFAEHPEKILALEMGGNNALVYSRTKDVRAAAYSAIQSAFITSGQRCTCARRLITVKSDHESLFIEDLVRMAKQLKVGSYNDDPEPFMGPVINKETALRILSEEESLRNQGGISLLPMKHLKENTGFLSPGIIDMTSAKKTEDEEIFGPLLQVIRTDTLEKAIEIANDTSYGLSAGLISDDEEEYKLFYQFIHAGIINWNTPLTGASSAAPFGGVGRSGNFRPSAYYAADYTSYPVSSLEISEVKLPKTLSPGSSN